MAIFSNSYIRDWTVNMNPVFRFTIISFFLLFLSSCEHSQDELTLLKVRETGSARIEDTPIIELIEENVGVDVNLQYVDLDDHAVDMILNNEVDLAIMPNGVDVRSLDVSELRTVVALLPRLIMILYDNKIEPQKNLKELLTGRRIGLERLREDESIGYQSFLAHYDLKPTDFETILVKGRSAQELIEQDSIDVFISLTHFNNLIVRDLLAIDWRFLSLDDPDLYMRGSNVEGFCVNFPEAYPYVLPKATFFDEPPHPVLTLAVRDILVCNESLDDELVYSLTENIMENKTQLTQANRIYGLLDFDYSSTNATFSFPIHDGAVSYMNKDEPSFFERYAESIGVIFSIFVVVVTTLMQIRNVLDKRKKERIDNYYKELLDLRHSYNNGEIERDEMEKRMHEFREVVFTSLMKEKLEANNSFLILLRLYDDIKGELALKS